METKKDYLDSLEKEDERRRMEEVLDWVEKTYPQLDFRIGWNQPIYTYEKTFIIAFSRSKKHLALAPEKKALDLFSEEVKKRGYDHSKELIRFPWDKEVDYELIGKLVDFNLEDKKGCRSFWRKS